METDNRIDPQTRVTGAPAAAFVARGIEQIEFASVDEALACARITPHARFQTLGSWKGGGGHRDAQDGGKWSGTRTFADADRLAVDGWPEGMARAEKLRAQLCGVLGSRSYRPRVSRDVAGFSPCVSAAIASDPESMFTLRRVMAPNSGKIVTIVYNTCVSAAIAAEVIRLRGAIAMALVDTLESSGFRCEVQLGIGCQQAGNNSQHETYITLKRPEDGLSVDTLAFWLIHPAAYRRMTFAIWENVWPDTCAFSGLGRPSEIRKERQGDIYLCEAHLAHVNNETAVPYLRETLTKFGVEFENEAATA